MNVAHCPICDTSITYEQFTRIKAHQTGWTEHSEEQLQKMGFTSNAIELARATGIACAWLTPKYGIFNPPELNYLDHGEYRVECLACGIGYSHDVSMIELETAHENLRKYIEERVQHEFRLLAADSGCSHWGAYRKERIERDIHKAAFE